MKQSDRRFFSILSAAVLLAGLISGANAYAAGTGPCSDDIAKFCPDVKPGGGAIMDCLEKHETELSAACREHEVKMHGKRGERKEMVQEYAKLRKTCGVEMNKFCRSTKPGGGRIIDCLNSHEKDLSGLCSETLKSMKSAKE